MKISFSHLKKYLVENSDISVISQSLFQLGHENEFNNNTLEIDFTPNKGDCLSVMGLARDLKALHKIDLKTEIYEKEINNLNFNFENNAADFCPQISFLKIEIDKHPTNYKDYLEDYFHNLTINKVNFFTDISNYLAYEIGQPTHCYDYESVKSGITLCRNSSSRNFKTVLGKEIKLEPKEHVFMMNKEIINFAGVMGGNKAKCKKSTKTALVECAYFNPDMIIGKSTKYDLKSDASYKFERGVDINMQEFALRRFIQIVNEHANIKSISIQSYSYKKRSNLLLDYDHNMINRILGTSYDHGYIKNILEELGFEISNKIKVPSWRSDIFTMHDISEEIARVVGYDNICTSSIAMPQQNNDKFINSKTNKLRKFLMDLGFYEVINDPFNSEYSDTSIVIDNPLDSNRKYLRLNVLNSLINNLDYNEKRQKDSIKLFELSNIYDFTETLNSKKMLSLIISGRAGDDYRNFNKKLDKNYLSDIAKKLEIDESYIKEIDRSSFDSKLKNKIFGLECNIENISDNLKDCNMITNYEFPKYSEISEYPLSNRDVSVSLDDIGILEDVAEAVFQKKLNNLKDMFIFDFYHNEDKNIIKLGFRFVFQSKSRTLEEVEVDKEMLGIFKTLLSLDGVTIPGLK
jgi:phenylalanyl-tRNA synthetase beta chain